MGRINSIGRMLLGGAFLASTVFIGRCTKAPSTQDVSKLEEQRSAAESAEKKLADLRQERMKLEHDLQEKQAQLQKSKAELQETTADTVKSSAGAAQVAPAFNDTAKAQVAAPASDSMQNTSK
jgi:septal ring factor EnvC (AmiA/AmiB activator)